MDDDLRTTALAHLLFLETFSQVVIYGDRFGPQDAIDRMVDEVLLIAPMVADEKDRREALADDVRRRRAGADG